LCIAIVLSTASCAHRSTSISRSLPERAVARHPNQADSVTDSYFDWPVNSARMTRGFFTNKRRPHLGLDLAAAKGSPILASRGGTVIYKGRDFRGFGNLIMIESPGGWATLYAHLDRFMVTEGQKVAMGEIIGTMGRTGRATGVHLHFEIRRNKVAVDPLPYLPGGAKLAKR
ncbi:MAG: M23 family metallopeptidase, partial [Bdellovibrionaceae bacterium]|nr:M23 family metallopeptidase [Pseudobdellovibrionaceae bacterium]